MSGLVIYIMGVSGSGKTTIGRKLSQKTGIPFFDGDDFHSKENKEKMQSGKALNDDDRKNWLEAIHAAAIKNSNEKGAIIACSALKAKYRATLSHDIEPLVRWVFLNGSYESIAERMEHRKHHFMPESLLRSQFDILEVPVDAIEKDISDTPDEIVRDLIIKLHI